LPGYRTMVRVTSVSARTALPWNWQTMRTLARHI
jgi:hypothetical protein